MYWAAVAAQGILSAAGTAAQLYAIAKAAQAQRYMAKYNEEVAKQNASMAQQATAFETTQIRRQSLKLGGSQRAAAASSGITLLGSFEDVYADSAVQGELRALINNWEGAIRYQRLTEEAKGWEVAQKNIMLQARLQRWSTGLNSVASFVGSLRGAPMGGGGGTPSFSYSPSDMSRSGEFPN